MCRVRHDGLTDILGECLTVSDLYEVPDNVANLGRGRAARWSVGEVMGGSLVRGNDQLYFLAPVDLRVVKAFGVTFEGSLIERVIEEKCEGDFTKAEEIRAAWSTGLGAPQGY